MDMTREHFAATFQLSPDTAKPIYTQLAEYLRFQIKSGVLRPGDRMIGENDMVEVLGVSRTTVRNAINQLVEEGYILRYRGKGSFIAEPRLKRDINYLYNFTENIRSAGSVPSSQVMRCEVVASDAALQTKMKLAAIGQKVFLLERLRMADGDPIIFETTYIPYYLCEGIETVDFSSTSLYNTLENRYGITIAHAEETMEAAVIDKRTAAVLQCKNGLAGYHIERISYLSSDYICEFTQSVTRGDRCVFKLDLYNNKGSNGGSVDFERQLNPVSIQLSGSKDNRMNLLILII